MKRLLVLGLALLPIAIVASCSSFSDDASTPRTTPDAAVPAQDANVDVQDATLDASADAFDGCTSLIDDDFTGDELDPRWIVAGDRPVVGFGELVLTPSTGGISGVWRAAPSPAGATLRISVDLHITPTTEGIADGMAIAWAAPIVGDDAGAFLSQVGGGAQDLAICPDGIHPGPAGALAVALLTYDNASEGFPPRHLAIYDQSASHCAGKTIATPVVLPEDAGLIPVSLQLAGAQLSGDELGMIQQVLPRGVGAVGWVGFTAATGGGSSTQSIAHVHVSSCQ